MTNNDELALKLKELAANVLDLQSEDPLSPVLRDLYEESATIFSAENIYDLLVERSAFKEDIATFQSRNIRLEGIITAAENRIENMLAERDADKKRIAELEEMAALQRDKIRRLESDHWDEQQLRKVHSQKSFELENEYRELKQRNDKDFIWRGKEINRLNDEVDALKEKCAAAGIKLEVGE